MLTDNPCARWEDAHPWAAEAAERLAATAWRVKGAAVAARTEGDVGYYADPATGTVALLGRGATDDDLALCKAAAARAVGYDLLETDLTLRDVVSYPWVKVAYSNLLRRGGELLNFFPGRYPGGVPNLPSPLAATLTGGLLGAGLGYGAGYVGENFVPGGRRGSLRRTLAVLGGLAGAFPGALGLYTNYRTGLSPLDGSVLAPPAGSAPDFGPYAGALAKAGGDTYLTGPGVEALPPRAPSVLDVNVDALGRTLWDSGADPRLTGVTMGVLRAAGSMPGGRGPGLVTPGQMGELAMAAGAGYASGALVGAVLGALTGLPEDARRSLARTGAAVGIVRAVVPTLFGQ